MNAAPFYYSSSENMYIYLIEYTYFKYPGFEKPGVSKGDVYIGVNFKYLPEFSFLLMTAGLDKRN